MFGNKRADEPSRTGELAPRVPSEARGNISRPVAQAEISTPPSSGRPEPKQLTVGSGISLSGEIAACDRLIVEGSAQVALRETRVIEITETGRFTNGKAEVEEAVVGGIYEGDLIVRGQLHVRSTGRVTGTIRYGTIQIDRGGKLAGSIEALERAQQRPPALAPRDGEAVGPEPGPKEHKLLRS